MTDARETRALLLAGGQSARMGEDKAAIVVDGEPLLARTAALAEPLCDSVHVSVRSARDADALRRRWPMIEDAGDGHGPLAGVLAALRSDPDVDWLVLACDLPRLDRATLEALLAAAAGARDAPAVAMASERDGTPEPLCAVWRGDMAPVVAARLADDLRCARRCLIDTGVPLVSAVTPGALANMNVPEDRRALVAGGA